VQIEFKKMSFYFILKIKKMRVTFQHENDTYIVYAWEGEECIGDFCIYGKLGSGETCSMSISVEDKYQKRGISRLMIRHMVDSIECDKNQLLFIDVDASAGFWDHIGMKINRYGLDYKGKRKMEGKGYEKVIKWMELQSFSK